MKEQILRHPITRKAIAVIAAVALSFSMVPLSAVAFGETASAETAKEATTTPANQEDVVLTPSAESPPVGETNPNTDTTSEPASDQQTSNLPTTEPVQPGSEDQQPETTEGSAIMPASGSDSESTVSETPQSNDVAKIGDTTYASLEDALNAAESGNKVVLLSDVVTTKELTVKSGVTLDGAGHKLSNSVGRVLSATGATVENLTINACGDGYAIYTNGNTTVKDCTFEGTTNWQPIYVKDEGAPDVKVDGCTFNTNRSMVIRSNAEFTNNVLNGAKGLTISSDVDGAKVESNTFNNARLDVYPIDNSKVSIVKNQLLGSSFLELENQTYTEPVNLSENYWQDYEAFVKNITGDAANNVIVMSQYADQTMSNLVAGPDSAAEVNGTFYASLQEAIDAAEDGDRIDVLQDLNLTDAGVLFVDGLVIDLNNHTIAARNFSVFFQGQNFTLQNGTFSACYREGGLGSYALWIGDEETSDNVLVQNIKTEGGINIYNATNVTLKDVDVVVSEETSGVDYAYYAVWCDENAHVTIESGNFSSSGVAVLGLTNSTPDKELVIKDGNFVSAGKPMVLNNGSAPVIYGGTFDADVSAYLAEDAGLHQNEDGSFVAHQHEWTTTTTDATCSEPGKKVSTCNVCNETYTEDYGETNSNAHIWDNGTVTTEATCTAPGEKTFTCTADGHTTKTEQISAKGHSWDAGVVTTQPTETTAGVRTHTCDTCHETFTEAIPALGNNNQPGNQQGGQQGGQQQGTQQGNQQQGTQQNTQYTATVTNDETPLADEATEDATETEEAVEENIDDEANPLASSAQTTEESAGFDWTIAAAVAAAIVAVGLIAFFLMRKRKERELY